MQRVLIATLFAVVSTLTAAAEPPKTAAPSSTHQHTPDTRIESPKTNTVNSQDETQMLAAVQASADAWNRGDLKGHLAIYDPSVTVMTKTGPRPTIEAIEKSFDQAYFVNGKPKQNLRMENVTIRSLSERSALMTGRFVLSGGAEAEQSGWFTLIWIRTAAGWRAVHDHTS